MLHRMEVVFLYACLLQIVLLEGYIQHLSGFSCKVKLSIDNTAGEGYSVPLSALFKDLKTDETSVWLYNSTDGQ